MPDANAYDANVLPKNENETRGGTDNNLYQRKFETELSDDGVADGFGNIRVPDLKSFEDVPGSMQLSQNSLRGRESERFEDLSRKTFKTVPITSEGIALDCFGGGFSQEEGRYKDADKDEQQERGRETN